MYNRLCNFPERWKPFIAKGGSPHRYHIMTGEHCAGLVRAYFA